MTLISRVCFSSRTRTSTQLEVCWDPPWVDWSISPGGANPRCSATCCCLPCLSSLSCTGWSNWGDRRTDEIQDISYVPCTQGDRIRILTVTTRSVWLLAFHWTGNWTIEWQCAIWKICINIKYICPNPPKLMSSQCRDNATRLILVMKKDEHASVCLLFNNNDLCLMILFF